MTSEKNILNRFYLVLALFVIFVFSVGFKLVRLQVTDGKKYEEVGASRVYKNFSIPANRGNVYDANGSLLATSVAKYDIRFDAVTVSEKDFNENVNALADSLSIFFNKPAQIYKSKLQKARSQNNRYLLLASNLRYSDFIRMKNFPLLHKGPYKGGRIVEQSTVRELPLGSVAERVVGKNYVGLEGAFNEYLKGKDGRRLKQKIAKGQWKPISDVNEIEPRDGLDIVSTIDVNIQDITHHALLRQLEEYKADHGTAVVMERKTGEIKAMANLGRSKDDTYYEKRNYAVWETQEPGSTFKLMAMVAALEDKVVDTAQVFDSEGGRVKYYNRIVKDSDEGGYGKISAGRAFELSSNTIFSKIVTQGYKNNEKGFYNRLDNMNLTQPTGLQINGESQPQIPHPDDPNWYGTTLPWLSFGYGLSLTPLQILNFYNAIANDGIQIKPRLVKEVRDRDQLVKEYGAETRANSICSKETAKIAQSLLTRTVEKGTASNVKSSYVNLAGKTGTAQTGYSAGKSKGHYTASFAGFFPAENPQYTVIVIVNDPDRSIGFYGGQVAAPAFKEIAEKIYTRTPQEFLLEPEEFATPVEDDFDEYYNLTQEDHTVMPNLVGLSVMDALPLLENMGLQPKIEGSGKILKQSIAAGEPVTEKTMINIKAQ